MIETTVVLLGIAAAILIGMRRRSAAEPEPASPESPESPLEPVSPEPEPPDVTPAEPIQPIVPIEPVIPVDPVFPETPQVTYKFAIGQRVYGLGEQWDVADRKSQGGNFYWCRSVAGGTYQWIPEYQLSQVAPPVHQPSPEPEQPSEPSTPSSPAPVPSEPPTSDTPVQDPEPSSPATPPPAAVFKFNIGQRVYALAEYWDVMGRKEQLGKNYYWCRNVPSGTLQWIIESSLRSA